METKESKPLSEAASPEEFKSLRAAARAATAEPAVEKTPQPEEGTTTESVSPVVSEKKIPQESQVAAELSLDDQIKKLRGENKHAAANKLEREAGASEARKAAADEVTRLKQELETLRSQPSARQPETTQPALVKSQSADAGDPEPQITDAKYTTADGFIKFTRDTVQWDLRQAEKKRQADAVATDRRVMLTKVLDNGNKYKPDFDAVAGRAMLATNVIMEAAQYVPNFGEVLYAIGSNPAEVTRIAALSPYAQYAEVARISGSIPSATTFNLSTITVPPKPEVTSVPLKPAVSRIAEAPKVLQGRDDGPLKSLASSNSFEEFKLRRRSRAS